MQYLHGVVATVSVAVMFASGIALPETLTAVGTKVIACAPAMVLAMVRGSVASVPDAIALSFSVAPVPASIHAAAQFRTFPAVADGGPSVQFPAVTPVGNVKAHSAPARFSDGEASVNVIVSTAIPPGATVVGLTDMVMLCEKPMTERRRKSAAFIVTAYH